MKKTFLGLFVLLCNPAMSQIQFGSLQEVLDFADQHAASIQNARDQERLGESRYKAARTSLLPSINGSAAFNDNITLQPTLVPAQLFNPSAPENTFNEYTFGRKYQYSAGLQASWDLLNFQKWFEVKTSAVHLQIQNAQSLHTRYRLYQQLAQSYCSILLSQRYLEISKQNLQAADSIYLVAQEKYAKGVFSAENLNRSKIQQIQAVQQLTHLESTLEQLYNQLQIQLNTSQKINLLEALPGGTKPVVFEKPVFTKHPALIQQEAQMALSTLQLEQAKSLYYPSISLGYQYNSTWASDQLLGFSNANHLPQQYWGLRLQIPLFNGMNTREKIQQSKISLHNQKNQLDAQRLQSEKEDQNLHLQHRQTYTELLQLEEMLHLQSQNDVHTKNRYVSGIIGLDERLDKFQQLLSIQNQYMQSLSNHYLSYYQLYLRSTLN